MAGPVAYADVREPYPAGGTRGKPPRIPPVTPTGPSRPSAPGDWEPPAVYGPVWDPPVGGTGDDPPGGGGGADDPPDPPYEPTKAECMQLLFTGGKENWPDHCYNYLEKKDNPVDQPGDPGDTGDTGEGPADPGGGTSGTRGPAGGPGGGL